MPLKRNAKYIPRARELRKEMTVQEKKLWFAFLRKYPSHVVRQKTISSFIVDFYCHEARLVIEVDGSQHYTEQGLAYDRDRTAILERQFIQVIRFTNQEIEQRFIEVCNQIDNKIQQRKKELASLGIR